MQTCDMGFVATEMAAHLRSGALPTQAWYQSLKVALESDSGGEGQSKTRADAGTEVGRGEATGAEDSLSEIIHAWARQEPRPRAHDLWGAVAGGLAGVHRYLRRWRQWWWERSPAGRRQRRAVETLTLACTFSDILGAPLADMLSTIGRSIDSDEADEEAREVAAAGPAASAHILNVLPILGCLAAWSLGAQPLAFFTSSLIGALVGIVGVALLVAGNIVSARMVAHARGWSVQGCDPALACDLVAAGLEGGAAIPRVLRALGEAADIAGMEEVARALIDGERWKVAWEGVDEEFGVLSQALQSAWEEGASPVPSCERAAMRVRQRRAAEARRRAARLNVRLVVPLGVFMLPSFIALGIVPLLLALAQDG